ncbi:MAG: methionyl-tRNA formyltransferase [Alphaproteobacteria bacterium]|nr:methionyl-tRNA formyltransferase [Alphaproteobacteria bacterium]
MNLIFMGTPDFAVPTLAAIYNAGHKILRVYTQPPRPAGRGHQMHLSAVHQYALKHQLQVSTPVCLKSTEEREKFSALKADVAIVAAYGLLLPLPLLQAPRFGCLNVHGSLLPRWRGAAPIHRAILEGDTQTGITIMQMEQGLDTGPIIMQDSIPIDDQATSSQIHDQLANLGAQLMLQTLENLQTASLKTIPQPSVGISYAKKLERSEGRIYWQDTAETLERKVRALNPWPGVWFEYQNARIKILKAQIAENPQNAAPGTILDKNFTVACGQDALKLLEIQKAGGRILEGQAFLNGQPIPKGTCFS